MKSLILGMALAAGLPTLADDSFSPALFWWWNSKLDVKELCAQVDDFYDHGSRTLCIHPFPKGFRPGRFPCDMEPDYLTDGYLDVYEKVTDYAAKKGMACWFYDEGGWPSGGACGQVVASDPERFALRFMKLDKEGRPEVVKVKYRPDLESSNPSVIEPGTTEKFLELTHEQVKKRIGRHFGKAVPWVFTDEPSAPHGWGLGWSTDFEKEFKARKGYDVLPFAPALVRTQTKGPVPDDVRKVRIDYYDVMSQLFIERFVRPNRDWCRENGLLYGGHFDGDDDMRCNLTHGHAHLLRCLREMDLPGVDCIWRQIHPDVDYSPLPRFASSAAHQTGAKRVLSETFAIFGETLGPDIMKRTVDFEMVRGVNQFVFAFAYQSTKRNFMTVGCPHLGPVDPKWAFMPAFMDYVRDTCARLAAGRNPVRVAVYYDVRSVWAGGRDPKEEGEAAYRAQIEVAKGLDARQVDFDFVDDDLIEAGRLPYDAIVFPTDRYLSETGRKRLGEFRARGGITVGPDGLDRVPRTCRATGTGHEHLRVTKRVRTDGSADYFLVNESDRPLDLRIAFPEGKELARTFDPYGSEFVRIGKDGSVDAKPPQPTVVARRELKNGWTVRKSWSVKPGKEDFEYGDVTDAAQPCRLGDWSPVFGTNFSGRAIYRNAFFSAESEAILDLGKVGVCAAVRLNGKDLEPKFFGPFRWPVRLAKGTNVLEVTVGNTLANALIPELPRIGREFPPVSAWQYRELAFYAKDDRSSGLIGPVFLDITRVIPSLTPIPSFRPGAVPEDLRARLSREIPEALETARRWRDELERRGRTELGKDTFQARRFFKRLELMSNLIVNTEKRFARGSESDFGHAERALDDLRMFRKFLARELDLWKTYPENPAVRPTVFDLRAFGAKGDGKSADDEAFDRAIAAVRALNGSPAVLKIPVGDYLLDRKGPRYNLILSCLTNFVLRGESPECVRLLCGNYEAGAVQIDRCENVTAAGFQNVYLKPTFFQGTVLKADNEKGFVEARLDPGGLAPTDPCWTNHYAIIRGSLYHTDGRMDADCPNAAFEFDADDLGGGLYRIWFSTRFTKRRYGTLRSGRRLAIPNRDNRFSAMVFNHATYCNFEKVWVRQARAAAFAGSLPRECSVVDCKDIPLEGMLMSSCADSSIIPTGTYLENCEFRGMGDDGFNTLTTGGFVCSKTAADAFVHELSPALVSPGELIQFMDPSTGEMLGNARIVSSRTFRWKGRALQEVRLDRPIPDGVTSYDDLGRGPLSHRELDQATVGQGKVDATPTHFYVPNAWGVGSVVSGCTFATTRCAGFVLQNSNTLVENCTVENAKTGFRINALGSFREGTPPQNVIVRDSTFSDLAEDGVIVYQGLQNTPPAVASMGFVRMENCAFRNVRKRPFALSEIADSVFTGMTVDGMPFAPRFIRNAENNEVRASRQPYGIVAHTDMRRLDIDGRETAFRMMREAGMGWVRVDYPWRVCQRTSDGRFDFGRFDAHFAAMAEQGLQPLPILDDAPAWARPVQNHYGDWRAFVEASVRRYGHDLIPVWEVWNEQNVEHFWEPFFGEAPGPERYFEFLKITSESIRAADPETKVMIGGFSGIPYDYIEKLYQMGAARYFDIMAVHPYARPDPPEGDLDVRLRKLRELMAKYGDGDKPIWITEIGWPTEEMHLGCPDLIREGLRKVDPAKTDWKVVYNPMVLEAEDPTGDIRKELASALPVGSEFRTVEGAGINDVLASHDRPDAVVCPFHGRYLNETVPALTNFVANGGVLIVMGENPFQFANQLENGTPLADGTVNPGTRRSEFRIGITSGWGKRDIPRILKMAPVPGVDAKLAPDSNYRSYSATRIYFTRSALRKGDELIPLLAGRTNGVEYVGACVYRFNSDWRGALVASAIPEERGSNSEDRQARQFVRAAAIAMALGVEAFIGYEFHAPERDPRDKESHYGITHADFSPKKAYLALKEFFGRRPAGSVQNHSRPLEDGALRLSQWTRPDGEAAGLVWRFGTPKRVRLTFASSDVRFSDLYGNPVSAVRDGRTCELDLSLSPVHFEGAKLESQEE